MERGNKRGNIQDNTKLTSISGHTSFKSFTNPP